MIQVLFEPADFCGSRLIESVGSALHLRRDWEEITLNKTNIATIHTKPLLKSMNNVIAYIRLAAVDMH